MSDPKIMTIKEVAKYLKMSENSVYKLVEKGKMPAIKVSNQWRLDKEQIKEWLGSQMGEFASEDLVQLETDHKEAVIQIAPLLKKENIIFNLLPTTKMQVLQQMVIVMVKNYKIRKRDADKLLHAIIERERLCSTAIGEGVAIPHPRAAVITKLRKPLLVLGICERGMDLESLDGKPTHLVFLVSAPRDDIHLKLMARLSRLLRDRKFGYQLTHATDFKQVKDIIVEKEKQI